MARPLQFSDVRRRFTGKRLKAESLVDTAFNHWKEHGLLNRDMHTRFFFIRCFQATLSFPRSSDRPVRQYSSEQEKKDTRCILASIMHHFRKKPSSSPTPTNSRPYTPIPPGEHTERESSRIEDQRPLAASSSANALSIVSASYNPSDIALNEPGSSKESAWKAAYGAAKIAIETIKESADMCLPLKAVAGALSVLVKNYDVRSYQSSRLHGC